MRTWAHWTAKKVMLKVAGRRIRGTRPWGRRAPDPTDTGTAGLNERT